MTTKSLTLLIGAAVVLGGAAYFLSADPKASVPKLNGAAVFPALDLSKVASVDVGTRLKLVSDEKGWRAETYHKYPVAHEKLSNALLALSSLKVGQVVRGKKLEKTEDLVLRDAAGAELAKLPLGEKHPKWGHGRYAAFKGETVLVSDPLDAFDGEGKSFVETKIVDEPYITFNDVVEGLKPEELGFATGLVARVTIAGDTNRTVTVGGTAKGGDRYLKIDKGDWVYAVPSYSVGNLKSDKK